MGLIDEHERVHAMEVQIQVASMISQGKQYWAPGTMPLMQ